MAFTFVDLFAGIGGFHAALGALGGKCVYASEWDKDAAAVYERNWNLKPIGDITLEANDEVMNVPNHDILVGGFPCQPFSKSGKQRGMDETRGTLFWNIARIIEIRKPRMVLLENVPNIAGPRHKHEWQVIVETLRDLGYRVSDKPFVVSPHELSPNYGGRPQVRKRVFICATKTGSSNRVSKVSELPDLTTATLDWNPQKWSLERDLPLESSKSRTPNDAIKLTKSEQDWIESWNEFVILMKEKSNKKTLPGFPIWADEWVERSKLRIPRDTPDWKRNFLIKNSDFYTENKAILDKWLKKWNYLEHFPPSRRKLEWQAQDSKSLWSTIMHFRPSGIRAKKPTYVPALVAITQTTILGKQKRRISVREAARLQGLPEWFDFIDQSPSLSFKQLGNAVNVGCVYNALKAHAIRDMDLLSDCEDLLRSILGAPANPDEVLSKYLLMHRDDNSESKKTNHLRIVAN